MQRTTLVDGNGFLTAEVLQSATLVFPVGAVIEDVSLRMKNGKYELRIEANWD